MWWPALGAIAVGVVGFFAPETMGVGYDNIRQLLSGKVTLYLILALSFLKFISWSVYLGSGTSGSTLAPLFTIGGGLGALLGYIILKIFPGCEINMATCALIGMAATFAGASRAILTAIVFAFETTAQPHGLLPLIGACTAAYLISFFLMKGGTLYTEKVERLGVHTPVALEADILQEILAKDVLEENINVLSADNSIGEVKNWIKENVSDKEYSTFVVINEEEKLLGLVKRKDIFVKENEDTASIETLLQKNRVFIYPDNELSTAVDIMDKFDTDVVPVIGHDKTRKLEGVLTHKAIFAAYRQRRNEDKIFLPNIVLKRQGIKIIVRGKKLFSREKDKR